MPDAWSDPDPFTSPAPAPSPAASTKAQRKAQHAATQRALWNAADTEDGSRAFFLQQNDVPLTQRARGPVQVLSRKPREGQKTPVVMARRGQEA